MKVASGVAVREAMLGGAALLACRGDVHLQRVGVAKIYCADGRHGDRFAKRKFLPFGLAAPMACVPNNSESDTMFIDIAPIPICLGSASYRSASAFSPLSFPSPASPHGFEI